MHIFLRFFHFRSCLILSQSVSFFCNFLFIVSYLIFRVRFISFFLFQTFFTVNVGLFVGYYLLYYIFSFILSCSFFLDLSSQPVFLLRFFSFVFSIPFFICRSNNYNSIFFLYFSVLIFMGCKFLSGSFLFFFLFVAC